MEVNVWEILLLPFIATEFATAYAGSSNFLTLKSKGSLH